ncbi:MAG TPA: hypothetical protein VLA37_05215 [Sphingomonadaceae bacterium]|nr:hypothetical protein [Sphingomonadaceae bacterium]
MTKRLKLACLAASVAMIAGPASADHWWGGYHWSISSAPLQLTIVDNVSGPWESVLDTSIADWNASNVLSLSKAAGSGSTRNCKAETGTVMVCNDSYGYNGWLGIAQIWLSGDHITKGVTKLNDSYYNTPTYNTTAWRNLVSCQEIGHAFGLAHQDEDFDNPNLDTCMDYTSNPESNQHPNQHDYDMLEQIYGHTHSSGGSSGDGGGPPPGRGKNKGLSGSDDIGNFALGWGRVIGRTADGRPDLYELKLGDGSRVITHVFHVPGAGRGNAHEHE